MARHRAAALGKLSPAAATSAAEPVAAADIAD
jgi:hypothetical protein